MDFILDVCEWSDWNEKDGERRKEGLAADGDVYDEDGMEQEEEGRRDGVRGDVGYTANPLLLFSSLLPIAIDHAAWKHTWTYEVQRSFLGGGRRGRR